MEEAIATTDPKAEKSLFIATANLPSDGQTSPTITGEIKDQFEALTAQEEKKLLRRIDWRLLPLLSVMYVVKTIDAQNVRLSPRGDKLRWRITRID